MNGYTPDTDQIKYRYQLDVGNSPIAGRSFDEAGAEFDRWLTEHDAQVESSALHRAADCWDAGYVAGFTRGNRTELSEHEYRHPANPYQTQRGTTDG